MDLSNLSITEEEQNQVNTKEENMNVMVEKPLVSPSVPTHPICGHEGTLWPM